MRDQVALILIESEGEHNGFFTIHFKDGTIREGWSCDQGGIEMDDDEPLESDVSGLCFESWFAMDIDDEYEGRHFATWTLADGLGPTTQEAV